MSDFFYEVLLYYVQHNNVLGGFYGLPFQLLEDTPVRFVSQLTWGHPACTLCEQLFDSYGIERYH